MAWTLSLLPPPARMSLGIFLFSTTQEKIDFRISPDSTLASLVNPTELLVPLCVQCLQLQLNVCLLGRCI